jgi:hypothetical protein
VLGTARKFTLVVRGTILTELLANACGKAMLETALVELGAILVVERTLSVFLVAAPVAFVVEDTIFHEVLARAVAVSVLETSGVNVPVDVGVGAFAVRLVVLPLAFVGGTIGVVDGAFAVLLPFVPRPGVVELVVFKKVAPRAVP